MQSKVPNELNDIEQKISSFYTYREGVIRELKSLRIRRKNSKVELDSLTSKINDARNSIGKKFQELNEIRQSRRSTLSKIRDFRSNMKNLENDLKLFEKDYSQKNNNDLVEELKSADWKLQTEKITRDEEKKLVDTIKELELRLRNWKKAYSSRQELNKFREEIVKLKDILEDLAISKENLELEIQTEKDKLSIELSARDQIFNEMDELNNDISELEGTLNNTDKELEDFRKKKKNILSKIKKDEVIFEINREQEMLKNVKERIKEKLSNGEKLTFEELKLVYDEKS